MRRLVIALLVLVGVLVAADFGAAALAESAVARQMRGQIGLADDPAVRINGFPFLTQAVAGEYSSIDVDATRISVGPFREVELTANLRDVTAPLSMLLGSGPKNVLVARVSGAVKIVPNDLERLYTGVSRLRIESVDAPTLRELAADDGDAALTRIPPQQAARLVGTVDAFGEPNEIAVIVELRLQGGKAVIVPRDARRSDGTALPIPASTRQAVLDMFAQTLDTGALPLEVTPTTFRAQDGDLVISGTASGLDIS